MTTDALSTSAMTRPDHPLGPFVAQPTVCLTTFRRDGAPVGTAVSLAVDEDRGFVRTYESSGKFKRLSRNPTVHVAPSTFRGRVTGAGFRAALAF